MSARTANDYSEEKVLGNLMAKVRSGTNQEVIDVLNAPIAPGTAFGQMSLLDALSGQTVHFFEGQRVKLMSIDGEKVVVADLDGKTREISGLALDELDYETVLEAEGQLSEQGSFSSLLFGILFHLANNKKKDAFEFLKDGLLRRGVTHVQIAGTIYGIDWEGLYNIDDAELRDKILEGNCEDLFPSSCGKFFGRPYKKDCPQHRVTGCGGEDPGVAYELQDLAYEDLSDSNSEIALRQDKLNCAWDGTMYQSDEHDQDSSFSFRHWITDDSSADPLDPASLYGDRTKDADKVTLVIKLDPRLTASA